MLGNRFICEESARLMKMSASSVSACYRKTAWTHSTRKSMDSDSSTQFCAGEQSWSTYPLKVNIRHKCGRRSRQRSENHNYPIYCHQTLQMMVLEQPWSHSFFPLLETILFLFLMFLQNFEKKKKPEERKQHQPNTPKIGA